jgi:L-amino acid N-acyltransferase YncA
MSQPPSPNKKAMTFRDAKISDLPRIVEIYNSTIPSRMVTADTEPVTVDSRISWLEKHSPGERPLWVIEQNNTIIGWVAFHDFYGRPAYQNTAEISIYLDEKFRGSGLGKNVLQYSLDQCPTLRIKNLIGYIFYHNEPSLKLFRSFGFQQWGMLPDVAVLDESNAASSLWERISTSK